MDGRRFRDRREAGRELARALAAYADRDDVVVLGLPRGGVPVAAEVARSLHAPLDVCVVRKLGMPGHEELAMGAVASGGVTVTNPEVLEQAAVRPAGFAAVRDRELAELGRRERAYRGDRPAVEVAGRTVVVVDDGLATGASMRAALAALRRRGPARLVAAVPVAAVETCAELVGEVDDVVCARTPRPFVAVGLHYDSFPSTTDEEVRAALAAAGRAADGDPGAGEGPAG